LHWLLSASSGVLLFLRLFRISDFELRISTAGQARYRRLVRAFFLLTVAANVALTLVSLAILPSPMAIHFGADGTADGWAPSSVNAILMTAVQALLFCSIHFTPKMVLRLPAGLINLPNKRYWLHPDNRPRLAVKLQGFMWRFGIALFLFFFLVGLLVLQANRTSPARLNLKIFFPGLCALLAFTVWNTISMIRKFSREQQGGTV
jgi:uncharacterized membrane protein